MNTPQDKKTLIVNDVIRKRRSVKPEKMSDVTIAKSIIDQIIENANWAPTHGLTEPWRFKIFAGDARAKLGQFLAEAYQEITPASKFQQTKYDKTKMRPTKASHVMVICMERKEKARIPLIEDIEAVACAVQNMHLTATAYGIAGYWSSGGATYSQTVKNYLELGQHDRCLGFFYLGYLPEKTEWPVGKRASTGAEKVVWY